MSKSEFLRVLEKMLELEEGSLKGGEKLSDVHWDSLAVVNFLAFTDERFGTEMSPELVNACVDVKGLYALIERASR